MSMPYKAVCFDIDGTLYPIRTMKKNLVLIALRNPIFCLRYLKNRKAFRKEQKNFTQDVSLRWREAMIIQNKDAKETQKPFEEKDYLETYNKLQKSIYNPMEKYFRNLKAFDGVRETFVSLKKKGIKIGLFTDFPLFESKLKALNISDLVDVAASSDDVSYLKPDTHCLTYLLYNLKLDSKDVLYVGDSYDKDIVGANAIKMDAVLVNVKKQGSYPLAKAVFSNWNDFDKWLSSQMEDNQ